MECVHLQIIYVKCTFAFQMPRAVHVILCQLYICIYTHSIQYIKMVMYLTISQCIYTVGIRARLGWESFVGEVRGFFFFFGRGSWAT